MLEIINNFLNYCLHLIFDLPTSFLLTDYSSDEEPPITEETQTFYHSYSALCNQCFKSSSCFNNIISPSPELSSLAVGVIEILWNATLAPVGRTVTDLRVISQAAEYSNLESHHIAIAIFIMSLIIYRAYVRRNRNIPREENKEDDTEERKPQ